MTVLAPTQPPRLRRITGRLRDAVERVRDKPLYRWNAGLTAIVPRPPRDLTTPQTASKGARLRRKSAELVLEVEA